MVLSGSFWFFLVPFGYFKLFLVLFSSLGFFLVLSCCFWVLLVLFGCFWFFYFFLLKFYLNVSDPLVSDPKYFGTLGDLGPSTPSPLVNVGHKVRGAFDQNMLKGLRCKNLLRVGTCNVVRT